jgi:TolB protein
VTSERHRLIPVAIVLIGTLLIAAACGEMDPEADPRLQPGSTDNARILFAKDGDIFLWDGSTTQLTDYGDATSPSWAPDGNQYLFVRTGDAYSDLYVANIQQETFQNLTRHRPDAVPGTEEYLQNVYWALDPAWSPSGTGIVYSTDRETARDNRINYLWYQAGPQSSPQRLNCSMVNRDNTERPHFSPDGTHVVFAQRASGRADLTRWMELRTCELNSGEIVDLLPEEESGFFPRWSPDGEWVVFVRSQDERSDLWVVSAEGGEPMRLTDEGDVTAPEWSPDGQYIAFMDRDGSGFRVSYIEIQVSEDGSVSASDPSELFSESGIHAPSGLSWIE